MNKRIATIMALALLAAAGWFFRWEFVVVSGGQYIDAPYVMNRWTGSLYLIAGDELLPVKEKAAPKIKFWETDKPVE